MKDAVPKSRYVVFAALAVGGCAADLLTKSWIFKKLGPPSLHAENIWWFWPGVFGLQTSINHGALFGIGQGMVWLFAALAFVAIVGVIYWLFVAGAARDRLLTIALGSVMAGIVGNLYDRLGLYEAPWTESGREFGVRDWILFRIGSWDWPNFNIADSMLVCGAALLVWHAFRQPSPTGHESTAAARVGE